MNSTLRYGGSSHLYEIATYERNSKAIGLLWGIFSTCYVFISVMAFLTPDWIGQDQAGKIGLWSICTNEENGQVCRGKLDNLMSLPGKTFQAATMFVALAVLTASLGVCAMFLFLCCRASTTFHTCGWMQLFSGICMLAGCATFPLGWNEETVQRICPNSSRFILKHCDIRWGYILAVIASLDGFILSILAFILATRHIVQETDTGSLYQADMNDTYLADSSSALGIRKTLNLHPVLLMDPTGQEEGSQFSQRTIPRSLRSNHCSFRHLPYSSHDFHM
ncbi:hypothetical protein HHI36_000500 [Cryptolaemus montrouzieri]|uniref:Uncharacterized protein n=1 Tax=Cryptolaemus montrouzieri TaxID=559131 RepID=A0ABD2P5I8_9CUCU